MTNTTMYLLSSNSALLALAHHEAGHAVASYALGRGASIQRIVLTPDDGGARFGCVHDGADLITTTTGIESLITEIYAGRAAQLCLSDDLTMLGAAWAECDEEQLDDLEDRLQYDETRAARLRSLADEIVTTNWHQVRALASELFEHGELDRHEIHDILHISNGVEAAKAYLIAYRKLKDRFLAY